MKNIAAFFDIDGTIFRNSLLVEHLNRLISYEIIDNDKLYLDLRIAKREWERRYGDYDGYIELMSEAFISEIKGIDKAFMEYIADQVIKTAGDVIYKYPKARIEWHKSQNHKIFFISGSPDFLVSRMAEKYGANEYRGTFYEVDEENKFTGNITPMWDSLSKKKSLRTIVEQYDIDMANSYAYGDTAGDLSMLQSVGNPIAINPNAELFNFIKSDAILSNKALIVVERKNMVYTMDASVNAVEF